MKNIHVNEIHFEMMEIINEGSYKWWRFDVKIFKTKTIEYSSADVLASLRQCLEYFPEYFGLSFCSLFVFGLFVCFVFHRKLISSENLICGTKCLSKKFNFCEFTLMFPFIRNCNIKIRVIQIRIHADDMKNVVNLKS